MSKCYITISLVIKYIIINLYCIVTDYLNKIFYISIIWMLIYTLHVLICGFNYVLYEMNMYNQISI